MKDQCLNITRISEAIEKAGKELFGENAEFDKSQLDLKSNSCNVNVCIGGKSFILRFFFKKDGKTTILAQGSDSDVGVKLIAGIVDLCKISEKPNFCFSLQEKDISFEVIDCFLRKTCNATRTTEKKEMEVIYRFNGPFHDILTAKVYSNGRILLQGKPLYLYFHLVDFLVNKTESLEKLVKIQNERYKVSISENSLLEEFRLTFPDTYDRFNGKLRTLIMTSMGIKKIDCNGLPDYAFFIHPAMKSLESFLKQVFYSENDSFAQSNHNVEIGSYFTEQLSTYVVKTEFRNGKITDDTQKYLGNIYKMYHDLRHATFHAGIIPGEGEIGSEETALEYINQVFALLDEGAKFLL